MRIHRLLSGFLLIGLLLTLGMGAAQADGPGTPSATTNNFPFIAHLPLTLYDAYPCPDIPIQLTPANGATLDTLIPMFRWDSGSPTCVRYLNLRVYSDAAGEILNRSAIISKTEGEGAYRFSDNFEPGTTYYWRIRFKCKNNVYGPFSELRSFTAGSEGTLPPMPAQLSPPNGSRTESRRVTMRWEAVPGASMYLLHYRAEGARGSIYIWVNQLSYSRTFEKNKTYEWWVAAVNDYGISEATGKWRFTTPANAP